MSATTAARPGPGWVRVHRAALAIAVLAVALAVTLSLLVVQLATRPEPVRAASGGVVQLDPVDDGCLQARPGRPC
jgi:hypothetical protein